MTVNESIAPERQTVTPAEAQRDAIGKIRRWFADSRAPQVFRLFGYAGTGKTTLAQHVVADLGLQDVRYAAYSGKAAHVLRTKGCDDASTIHSLIYAPVAISRAELDRLQTLLAVAVDEAEAVVLRAKIAIEERKLDRPRFELRADSDLRSADLLILDEVSMVNETIARDLLSFGTKVLALGDPAQLPPVEGGGYFTNHAPDAMLTEVHRSAADSPVTRIATAVRSAEPGDRHLGVHEPDEDSGRRPSLRLADLLDYDQVIVGTNATRWSVVHAIRGLHGRRGPVPIAGDRIMTLVNSPDADVLNGQQFTVTGVLADGHVDRLQLAVQDDEGAERALEVWRSGFVDLAGEKDAKRRGRSRTAAATFSQAITCHKSQGSQWDRVLVLDESAVFRAMTYKANVAALGHDVAALEGHVQARRWLYTAVTRAASQAVIVEKGAVA